MRGGLLSGQVMEWGCPDTIVPSPVTNQWGMNWGIEFGVPDSVRLLIQIEAVQQ